MTFTIKKTKTILIILAFVLYIVVIGTIRIYKEQTRAFHCSDFLDHREAQEAYDRGMARGDKRVRGLNKSPSKNKVACESLLD